MSQIWEPEKLVRQGYKINVRKIKDVRDIIAHSPDFQKLKLADEDFLYTGAEHIGKPKFQNITLLPNVGSTQDYIVYGSTFGHQHLRQPGDNRPFQELYEFQNYGAMLLRSPDRTQLVLARPGEKVFVKTTEDMTLFNLGREPLITLDYANPEKNHATKELEKRFGPLMIVTKEKGVLRFGINPAYREEELISGEKEEVLVPEQKTEEDLFKYIEGLKKEFNSCGIGLIFGGNIPQCLKQDLSEPLVDLVNKRNRTLMDLLK